MASVQPLTSLRTSNQIIMSTDNKSPNRTAFVITWIFNPTGAKQIFDYLRNTGLCALLMFSALFLEKSVLDSPLYEISNSSAYSEMCTFATTSYEKLVQDVVKENAKLYFEGFKEGGMRLFSAPDISEHEEIKRIVGAVEFRKKEQITRNYLIYLLSLFIYAVSFLLLAANVVTWYRSTVENLLPVRSKSVFATLLRVIDRYGSLIGVIIITIPVFLGIYTEGDKLLGGDEKSKQQIIEYEKMLGANEYDSVSNYFDSCL